MREHKRVTLLILHVEVFQQKVLWKCDEDPTHLNAGSDPILQVGRCFVNDPVLYRWKSDESDKQNKEREHTDDKPADDAKNLPQKLDWTLARDLLFLFHHSNQTIDGPSYCTEE